MKHVAWKRAMIPVLLFFAFIIFVPLSQASDWDDVVAKAKKEGKVLMYGVMPTKGTLPAVIKGMKEKYGIKVENMRMHPREAIAKIKAETAAKTYQVDVVQSGPYTYILDNLDFFMDPGSLPAIDSAGADWVFSPRAYKNLVAVTITPCGISVNTNHVAPGTEPRTWKDLADPKFRGRIIIDDPRRSSIMHSLFAYLVPKYGKDWMKAFIIDNKPILARDVRMVTSQLARGEWEIYVGSLYRTPRTMLNKTPGLPIKWYYPEEGAVALVGTLSISKNSPHPNAARVFLNYMLSQGGQEAYGVGLNIPLRLGTKVPHPDEQDPGNTRFLRPLPPPVDFVKVESAKYKNMAKEMMGKK